MRFVGNALISMFIWACGTTPNQRLEIVEFEQLHEIISSDSGKIEVINFWATWCKPCVSEIDYFQAVHSSDHEVNVTLVSLDFADEFESKVVPFVKSKRLTADVLLLNDVDYNSWIDRIEPSWSGAIPATLVINHKNGKRKFIERELEEGEIESIIDEISD